MNRSEQLKNRIEKRIRRDGIAGKKLNAAPIQADVRCISFYDYMEMCLYDQEYGYYRSGAVRVGKSGDFYTSSAVGTIMGEKLAGFLTRLVDEYGGCADVGEWGAGTGRLSKQIIDIWEQERPDWLSQLTYMVVDGSPVHLAEAERLFQESRFETQAKAEIRFMTPQEAEIEHWRDKPLIIFANELLDAFPVHRLVLHEDQLWEMAVTLSEEDSSRNGRPFQYAIVPLTNPELEQSLAADGIKLAEGQEVEINLAAERWIKEMSARMSAGALIIIDYGHEADELAGPHRMKGTLLCYKDHIAHDDPFRFIGEQDITAHVNFMACRRAAEKSGWKVSYYQTQKQFLIDQGVLDDLVDHDGSDPFSEAAKRNRSIRQLLWSDIMSEAFKVMILQK
ncbi:class I SAM-dependent methyltransferase [Paenibacillus solisilvae]|uniref:Class I SAM-dependent methyltransferase n=1 Tax=Paenibacillus solisilvae TaxID=2486751 RepID=A0ABW0W0N8_9BACL